MSSQPHTLSLSLPFQSRQRGGQQSEALPRKEEERFKTTQSVPGPHHPQVCVVAQPEGVSLAQPQGHLRHQGKDFIANVCVCDSVCLAMCNVPECLADVLEKYWSNVIVHG